MLEGLFVKEAFDIILLICLKSVYFKGRGYKW